MTENEPIRVSLIVRPETHAVTFTKAELLSILEAFEERYVTQRRSRDVLHTSTGLLNWLMFDCLGYPTIDLFAADAPDCDYELELTAQAAQHIGFALDPDYGDAIPAEREALTDRLRASLPLAWCMWYQPRSTHDSETW